VALVKIALADGGACFVEAREVKALRDLKPAKGKPRCELTIYGGGKFVVVGKAEVLQRRLKAAQDAVPVPPGPGVPSRSGDAPAGKTPEEFSRELQHHDPAAPNGRWPDGTPRAACVEDR
jgi:hypothetical protein